MSFLFRYLRFHDIIGGIHVPVDDGVDKMNRKYTLLVFLFLALPIFTKQYIGDPIECFSPVFFVEHQARYINSYCWTQSTYYMVPVGDADDDNYDGSLAQDPPDRILTDEMDLVDIGLDVSGNGVGTERIRRVRVSYYQWAPLILLVQGCCFYIPFLIWNSCAHNAGVKLRRLLKKASDIASLPPGCQQREALLAEFVDQFHTLVTGEAGWCTDPACQLPLACRYKVGGPSSYLCLLYLVVKSLYVFNVGLQFFLLGSFLGRGYMWHGWELVRRLFVDGDWWASPRFPLSTLCQVRADIAGGLRAYTCQCVLPINVFNEKIFSVVWFYMAFLMPLNFFSLVYWIWRTTTWNRLAYIRLCLWRTRLVVLQQIPRTARRLSSSYLGWDGVFLLRLIEHNHGSIMATLIMSRLWEFYANQMKLQEDANQLMLTTAGPSTEGGEATGGPSSSGGAPPGGVTQQQPQASQHAPTNVNVNIGGGAGGHHTAGPPLPPPALGHGHGGAHGHAGPGHPGGAHHGVATGGGHHVGPHGTMHQVQQQQSHQHHHHAALMAAAAAAAAANHHGHGHHGHHAHHLMHAHAQQQQQSQVHSQQPQQHGQLQTSASHTHHGGPIHGPPNIGGPLGNLGDSPASMAAAMAAMHSHGVGIGAHSGHGHGHAHGLHSGSHTLHSSHGPHHQQVHHHSAQHANSSHQHHLSALMPNQQSVVSAAHAAAAAAAAATAAAAANLPHHNHGPNHHTNGTTTTSFITPSGGVGPPLPPPPSASSLLAAASPTTTATGGGSNAQQSTPQSVIAGNATAASTNASSNITAANNQTNPNSAAATSSSSTGASSAVTNNTAAKSTSNGGGQAPGMTTAGQRTTATTRTAPNQSSNANNTSSSSSNNAASATQLVSTHAANNSNNNNNNTQPINSSSNNTTTPSSTSSASAGGSATTATTAAAAAAAAAVATASSNSTQPSSQASGQPPQQTQHSNMYNLKQLGLGSVTSRYTPHLRKS